MSSTRQLLDVVKEWRACEEACAPPEAERRTGSKGARGRSRRRKATLESTIETEIIPRLLLTHRVGADLDTAHGPTGLHPSAEDVAEFVRLLLDHDTRVAFAFVDAMRAQGSGVETLFLELLAPAARLLGELWKADVCDFTDVTIGLSRLQQLLHELSPAFEDEAARLFSGRQLLLATAPGEQHTLGLMMVEEFFNRSGWDCTSEFGASVEELVKLVRRHHFDVVGLSASCDTLLGGLASAIEAIRKSSRERGVIIMVGGQIFLDRPELAARLGADATAQDGREAVMQLHTLLTPNLKTLG
jgi:methanogenic corrinoid protein MtbC1